MNFFFDNCLSPKYAEVLTSLGENITHLREVFDPSAKDEDWIPEVARRGWVAVSFDRKILKTPMLATALERARLCSFFLPGKIENKPLLEQAAWLCARWGSIRTWAESRDEHGEHVFLVNERGHVTSWGKHRAKRKRRRKSKRR